MEDVNDTVSSNKLRFLLLKAHLNIFGEGLDAPIENMESDGPSQTCKAGRRKGCPFWFNRREFRFWVGIDFFL